ncbi:MAG: OsmC family protein, partial [Caulobacteraceae bacterium]
MSAHKARVSWRLGEGEDFPARRYSRLHRLSFEGGLEVPGSPSPAIVPAPFSSPEALDPEGAFVAALSACHMLWFLDLAAGAGLTVESYVDSAEGTLGRIAPGRMGMTRVVLRPAVRFAGRPPSREEIDRLHEQAHARCFIANSVSSEVAVEP